MRCSLAVGLLTSKLETVWQRLGVAYVLRGSIRQNKDQVRLCAYLIDTAKRHYVWSEVHIQVKNVLRAERFY